MCLGNPQWRSDTKFNILEETDRTVVDLRVDVEGQGTYSITGGADAALFDLDPQTGVLSFKDNAPDFENPLDSDGDNDYHVTVSFTDIRNATVTRDLSVHVQDVNDPPVITSNGGGDTAEISSMENMAFVTDVEATDNDGDAITYSIAGGADADLFKIDGDSGRLSFKDAPDFENPTDAGGDNMYHVTVQAEGGSGFDPAVNLAGRTFFQFGGNYYLQTTGKQTWANAQAEAQSFGGNLVSVDSDAERTFIQQNFSAASIVWTGLEDINGDEQLRNVSGDDVVYSYFNQQSVTYPAGTDSIASPQAGSSAVILYDLWPNASYFLDVSPNNSYNGIIEIDPNDFIGKDTQEIKITVTDKEANAVDDNVSTPKDTAVDIDVLANDSASQGEELTITSVEDPLNGTAVLNNDGTITYTPNAGFAGGFDTFTYHVSDALGETDSAKVNVFIDDENTPPIAQADSATTNEDTAVSIDVLANDSDINGDNLRIKSVDQPANGTAEIVNGQVLYTPDANFNGTDTFTYAVRDGKGGMNMASVTVDVLPVNDAPNAVDDVRNIDRDQTVVIDVLANDSDVDGDSIRIQSNTQPGKGAAFVSGDQIVYDPNPNATGMDSFTYTIADGNGGRDTATVKINIGGGGGGGNRNPVAVNDSATVQIGQPQIGIRVLDNDSDPDGDQVRIKFSDTDKISANGGTIRWNRNGTPDNFADDKLVYRPADGFSGNDSFTYAISDGNGGMDMATVNINVLGDGGGGGNRNPVAVDDSATVQIGQPQVGIRVLDNDSDPDGDQVRIKFSATDRVSANGGTIKWNRNGTPDNFADDKLVYRPADGFTGNDSFTYAISDGNGGMDMATVRINVLGDNGGGGDKVLLQGTSGNDLLEAARGNIDDDIRGAGGNDTLKGFAGHDCLVGGAGNDKLHGNDGDDRLNGSNATRRGVGEWDVLTGGKGNDVFVLGDKQGAYYIGEGNTDLALIKDFEIGQDKLVLSGSDSDYHFRGNEIYQDGDLVANLVGVQTDDLTSNDVQYV